MNSDTATAPPESSPPGSELRAVPTSILYACLAALAVLLAARLVGLGGDPPLELARDGFLYTDEGWYSGNAIWWAKTGSWYSPYNLNNAVTLPVQQVFDGVAFALFGPRIEAARLVVLGFFVGGGALLWWLMRRYCGDLAAGIAVGFLAINHLAFEYSRISIAEVPMGVFVLVAVAAALEAKGKRLVPMTAVATAAMFLAMLTKTSAIHGVPLVGGILLWRGGIGGKGWIAAVGFGAVLGGAVALHAWWASAAYPKDYDIFYGQNIGQRSAETPTDAWNQGMRFIRHGRGFERIAFYPSLVSVMLLLMMSRRVRRQPLAWVAVAWFALYLLAFSMFTRIQPRYFAGMLFPAAMIIAVAGSWGLSWGRRHPFAWIAGAVLAASAVWNLSAVTNYVRHRDDSMRRLARAVEEALDAESPANRAAFCHFAQTLALYGDILPVNSVFAPSSVEERWKEYRPLVFVSQGPIENNMTFRNDLARFARWELVSVHDVFENYRDYETYVYRLIPLGEDEEGVGEGEES